MKIVQWCNYKFPATGNAGAERVVERTCRGLQKLGHEVVLCCKEGSRLQDIKVVHEIPKDADIVHHHGWCWWEEQEYNSWGIPWVSTIHGGGMETDPNWLKAANNNPHIICVSKFVADRIGVQAFVHTSADPAEFVYKKEKQNYFLYLSSLDWGFEKGLDIFINLSKLIKNSKFVIAGKSTNPEMIKWLNNLCSEQTNLSYAGEVNGSAKAELFANAKAYILPTQLPDACPTTVAESLMSGTPVIGSTNGAMPEIVTSNVGFVCKNQAEYIKAIMSINKINPEECRRHAEEKCSDVVTAQKYLQYYENMLKYNRV